MFKERITCLIQHHFPSVSSSKLGKRKKPWINGYLIKLIRKRKRAFSKYCQNKSPYNFDNLKDTTALYKIKSREARKKYFEGLATDFPKKKRFWKHMKCCGSKKVHLPSLRHDGLTITEDRDKA